MSLKHDLPEGTSEPQHFALTSNGSAIDGTGCAVALVIKKKNGATLEVVDDPPTVDWLDAAAGTVEVTGTEDLEPGNYCVNYAVTDGAGKVSYFPNNNTSDLWVVKAVPTYR